MELLGSHDSRDRVETEAALSTRDPAVARLHVLFSSHTRLCAVRISFAERVTARNWHLRLRRTPLV